jgi:transposase
MPIARFKRARVNIDYHVELDGHYYSVPHRLVRTEVELRVTATTVEVLAGSVRVAVHAYSAIRGAHTTLAEHMPASHRAHREWSPAKLIAWGERIGVATAAVVRWQMEHRPHPEQGYRACLGMQRLAREFTPARLEAACTRAMAIRSPNLKSVTSIPAQRAGSPAPGFQARPGQPAAARQPARARLLPLTPIPTPPSPPTKENEPCSTNRP